MDVSATSRRVMETLGMTLTRTFRYDGASVPTSQINHVEEGAAWEGDDVEYAIERARWES